MRAVIDTNVLLSGLLWHGQPHALLGHARVCTVSLASSPALRAEPADVSVAQQTVQAYEISSRRIPVSTLPVVANTLSVLLEIFFGEQQRAGRKRGPLPQWRQQMEAVARLPKSQQRFVSRMLQTVLGQAAAR